METRVKAEKSKKEGDIFESYKPSEQRKADQAAVDAQVILCLFELKSRPTSFNTYEQNGSGCFGP